MVATTVSLIIINYNGAGVLEDCLDSVLAQSRPPDDVIVVDNCSQDESRDWLARTTVGSGWRCLLLDSNLGYAGACNSGIKIARGSLIGVLNNDLVLAPEWLESLLRHDQPPWNFWASKILYASRPSHIDSAGDGMAVVGSAFKRGHGEATERFQENSEVFGACGAAALFRREVLQETGGFDPDFFLIYEDADLSMRARLLGHRCLFVAGALVYHRVNASIGALSSTYVYYGHRNSEYLFWQNMPTSLLLRFLPERLLFNLLCLIYFACKGRGLDFLRSKKDFLAAWRKVRAKRREIQSRRVLTTSQVRRLLERNWLLFRRNLSLS